ncbi:hypothetical protein MBLNU457_7494t1 [Dothideomycetes sp. NU457]
MNQSVHSNSPTDSGLYEEAHDDFDDDFVHNGLPPGEQRQREIIKRAWPQLYDSEDTILFGSRKTNVQISTLHPEPHQIFRLWQTYLDNVDPLLKVTHTPTLQALIVDAISNLANIRPSLEALMFSIYCVAISTLSDDQCFHLFGASKKNLLTGYHFACQQALLNCGILSTSDHDCLVALYLYLISIRPTTDPQTLGSMMAIAMRIAQRMGIHNESSRPTKSLFDSEVRRRLWWSLVVFDHRICELSDSKATMLAPIWNCKIPLNVNDFDLRPDMKALPLSYDQPTEAVFTVVRSELADFVRRSSFHLDFINPALKLVAGSTQSGSAEEDGGLAPLEKSLEEKYLRRCNQENPLHFMTVWMTRGWLAKYRLFQYLCLHPDSADQTEADRDNAITDSLTFIQCDTKLTSSPLTKRFTWLHELQFPLPAYIYLVQDLTKRPLSDGAELRWTTMNDNYEARFPDPHDDNILLRVLGKNVLAAWESLETASNPQEPPFAPPRMVTDVKHAAMRKAAKAQSRSAQRAGETASMRSYDPAISSNTSPMDLTGLPSMYGSSGQGFVDPMLGGFQDSLDPTLAGNMGLDMDGLDWNTILMQAQGW